MRARTCSARAGPAAGRPGRDGARRRRRGGWCRGAGGGGGPGRVDQDRGGQVADAQQVGASDRLAQQDGPVGVEHHRHVGGRRGDSRRGGGGGGVEQQLAGAGRVGGRRLGGGETQAGPPGADRVTAGVDGVLGTSLMPLWMGRPAWWAAWIRPYRPWAGGGRGRQLAGHLPGRVGVDGDGGVVQQRGHHGHAERVVEPAGRRPRAGPGRSCTARR